MILIFTHERFQSKMTVYNGTVEAALEKALAMPKAFRVWQPHEDTSAYIRTARDGYPASDHVAMLYGAKPYFRSLISGDCNWHEAELAPKDRVIDRVTREQVWPALQPA